MHCLVQDRRRNLGVGMLGIDGEGQLDEARALLVEVGAPAGEALHDDVGEVAFQVAEMVWNVPLDQLQRSLESRNHVGGIDVGPRVVDNYRNAAHDVATDAAPGGRSVQEPKNLGEHDIKIVVFNAESLQLEAARSHICAPMTTKTTTVLDARAVERTLKRMSVEIVELNRGTDDLIIVGIQRRGVQLADRLVKMIEGGEGVIVPQGSLDITLYRDDLQTVGPRPVVGPTHLPWDLEGKHIVIVDDVLYTGRTVRAALDELADFGRPAKISLAVLIDRGGRELPIHADVVGKKVEVGPDERVDVLVAELDERTEVVIVPNSAA